MGVRYPGRKPTITTNPLEMIFDVFGDLVKAIIKSIMGIFIPGGGVEIPGLPSGVNPLGFLSDLLGMRWDQVDAIDDGQVALTERTDLLSPLLDYGSVYASTSNDISNTGQFSYSNQVGPMQNCHLSGGRIILDEQGLWNISARIYIALTFSPVGGGVAWEVRVLRPDGSIFSTTEDVFTDTGNQTREINTSVVVPGAGYQIQVYVRALLVGRWINGGPHRSRLTVQHISRSTIHQITE